MSAVINAPTKSRVHERIGIHMLILKNTAGETVFRENDDGKLEVVSEAMKIQIKQSLKAGTITAKDLEDMKEAFGKEIDRG